MIIHSFKQLNSRENELKKMLGHLLLVSNLSQNNISLISVKSIWPANRRYCISKIKEVTLPNGWLEKVKHSIQKFKRNI